jgi:ribosomal protein L12E/L44/L45/RPP1/RPP2
MRGLHEKLWVFKVMLEMLEMITDSQVATPSATTVRQAKKNKVNIATQQKQKNKTKQNSKNEERAHF